MTENGHRSNGHEDKIPPTPAPAARWTSILPGDTVTLRGEGQRTVRTIFVGNETIGGATTEWRWLFLDDGSLLEVAPKGTFRYAEHRIWEPGTDTYELLVAQDGALVRFEQRVREGTVASRPVHVTLDGVAYRIASTGTASTLRFGPPPEPAPWAALQDDPAQNVYFNLVATDDPARVILGLWTLGVCLSLGRPVAAGDATP